MKNLLFLCSFLLFSSSIFAQKQQDFIINLNSDTIWGKIKIPNHSQKITFKTADSKAIFQPNSLLVFGIYNKRKQDHTIYKSVRRNKTEKVFLKVVHQGKLQLFEEKQIRTNRRSSYQQIFYYMGRTEESLHLMIPNYYEAVMEHYLKEQPLLASKLKQSTFYDIPNLVLAYNNIK